MPKDPRIKKVLVIGSGPIIIGQAAEFDYSGTQACRALKSEGIETVLVNSNPATIMTDPDIADHVYIEPLTAEVVERIIEKEKPDAILPNLGGQMGLNLSMELARSGFLDRSGVRLLACKPDTIDRAEDRQLFKDTMEKLNQPCIPSKVVEDLDSAMAFADVIGYPVIVRPAFTMGGTGGGICENPEKLHEIATNGLRLSPIHQILVEKCIAGWKEIEYEVMRDHKGNVITVCNMENLDPVGVHTGDSIVVAPSQTLSDKEYQMLRTAALDIITELGIEGGCNCQFALKPDSFEYAVIEVNPRVSRSSALASKATGYPIAKVATKIALGYTLDEITNDVTGETCACFEPALDYVVVKYPKWPFDKFVYADKSLGTQMMATGEVMAIGNNFEHAMMKAVSSIELGMDTLTLSDFEKLTTEEVIEHLHVQDSERAFCVYEALKRGVPHQTIYDITKIDWWFLDKMQHLANLELGLKNGPLTREKYLEAKHYGFLDKTILRLSGAEKLPMDNYVCGFKMVDTCAAEFAAKTPYFYSTCDKENEAEQFINAHKTGKKKILVFGSGPIRIGQGIEFDYCCVHASKALRADGWETIMVNCNPETVSTDFDTSDRLYFEPVTLEDVLAICEVEKPAGVIVQYGGQTPLKLCRALEAAGVPIIGTTPDAIDCAEDRERFQHLLQKLNLRQPPNRTARTEEDAIRLAAEIGYPLVVRPSYVLGGRAMDIVHTPEALQRYMKEAVSVSNESPVLLDRFLDDAVEMDVDAVADGHEVQVAGVMEHIEQAGVHSGDSACSLPPYSLPVVVVEEIKRQTKLMAEALNVVGLMNVQFAVQHAHSENPVIYVLEVNPRASRTVPFVSKATGNPVAAIAARVMAGQTLAEQGVNLEVTPRYVSVKEAVFPFSKFLGVDPVLGPEMRSTGEVMGVGRDFGEALFKSQLAAGSRLPERGSVFISVRECDKPKAVVCAHQLHQAGFPLVATAGTAHVIQQAGIPCRTVGRIGDAAGDVIGMMEAGDITLVIMSVAEHEGELNDARAIRKLALAKQITYYTTMAGGLAASEGIRHMRSVQVYDLQGLHAGTLP